MAAPLPLQRVADIRCLECTGGHSRAPFGQYRIKTGRSERSWTEQSAFGKIA